ncbi:sugar ABC transporter permease [Candidatus Aerophobetes bacterium]|nr:sugar ABC transporter permease [Candidatus Aerophobetes bacterium]
MRRTVYSVKFLGKWFFILPAIIFFIGMVVFPMIWSLSLSFYNWKAATGGAKVFIGLKNFYTILAKDVRFWGDLRFTLFYVGMTVLIELLLGLGLASLLNKKIPFRNFFRVIYLLPMTAPPIAVAFLWRMFLQPDVGIINQLLHKISLPAIKWTTDVSVAPWALVIVDIWEWTPFMFLGLLAALQSLPQEIYDAAAVDGASPLQAFIYVTIPMVMPIIVTLVLLRAIDAFKLFELVFGITGGGPGGSTESLSYYIYTSGLSYFDIGYSCALSWVFLIIVLFIAIFVLRLLRKEV